MYVATLAVLFVFLGAEATYAGPVVAAVGAAASAIGGILAGGGIGAFALKLGGSLILSAASSAFMGRGKAADPGLQGRAVSVREAAAARRLIYGRARVGGTIVFVHTNPTPGQSTQNELHLIIVLAGHRLKSIGNIYFNGELAFWNDSGSATGRFYQKAGVSRALGGDGQVAFRELAAQLPDLWTAQHQLDGCAAIWLKLYYNPDTYPSGIPNITADVEGCDEVFDPRTGSTGYSENPALCLAHYMAHPQFGLNAAIGAADGVATADLVAAANVCDELVAKVGGGNEPRYSLNGVIDTGQAPKDIIEDMLTAMAGDMVPVGGQYQIFAGAWRAPTVTLTDDDVVAGGFRLTTRVSRADNFNGVRGKFVSPENDWAVDDFPAYASSVYLAEDKGERVWTDITLPFTVSASMAQRLAKIHLERQRRQFTVTFPAKLSAWRLAPMDTVALTRARWGFSGKVFEVRGMSLDIGETIEPQLTLRETSPLIYDWATTEAQIYAAAPRTVLPNAFDLPRPGGITVTESLYETRGGVRAQAVLTWSAAPSPYVATYEVQGRRNGAEWAELGRVSETRFEWLNVAPGLWGFRVRARSNLGVVSGWTEVTQEILGLAAPPVALSDVRIQAAGGLAVLKWALHPDLDVRSGGTIVIRHSAAGSPSWANSVSMDEVPGATAIAVVPLKPGAYVLRARDSSGSYGPESVISTAGAQVIAFLTGSTLTEDTAFSGTKTGLIVDSGALRLDVSVAVDSVASFDGIVNVDALGGVLPSGTYQFATALNLGSAKAVRLRSVIRHSVLGLADLFDTRPTTVDAWPLFDGLDGGEVDVVVECRTTTDNPAGTPVWGPWGRVENTEVVAWGVQARAILTSLDAGFTPAVDQLRLIAQEAA